MTTPDITLVLRFLRRPGLILNREEKQKEAKKKYESSTNQIESYGQGGEEGSGSAENPGKRKNERRSTVTSDAHRTNTCKSVWGDF